MPSSTLEGNSACHGFDNGSKPLCASFTNPIRCTIPFVHVKMYAVDVFTQFTHAPFTISNEFTTVCWVCYTLILDAFPPVHNISKSETHFNIFEQYNKGNISTQHIFFRVCFTVVLHFTYGSSWSSHQSFKAQVFFPQNLLIEGEICDLSLRQLRGERLRLVPLAESHFCK